MKTSILMSCIFFASVAHAANQKALTPVLVGASEGLQMSDSTSSERYRESLEAALYYAVGENERKINACGYSFTVMKRYYESSKPLGALESAKDLKEKGAWIIFGPRRSEDFLKTIEGVDGKSVVVSPMAEASVVQDKKPPIFSMYPHVSELAGKVSEEIQNRNYGKKYVAIIDATCPSCREFVEVFEKIAQTKGLRRVTSIDVTKNLPKMEPILAELGSSMPDFVLLPNTSILSGYLINQIHSKFPQVKFVGSNGWGDEYFGFLNKFGLPKTAEGFCVRGGLSYPEMESQFRVPSLKTELPNEFVGPGYTATAMVEFLRKVSADLCRLHPKSKENFVRAMSKEDLRHFKLPKIFRVLDLKDGNLAELKKERLTKR